MPASFRKQKLHFELYTLNAARQNRRYAVMLRDSVGSFSEAHREYLSVRCVPIAASRYPIFSVSYGDNRRSVFTAQSLRCAQLRHW
jgi:hypothetical protein